MAAISVHLKETIESYGDPVPSIPYHFPTELLQSVLKTSEKSRRLDMMDLSGIFKGTDYVPVICGTGWSWNDLPPDFDFQSGSSKAILFLLNGAAMAPQFWDHEKKEYRQPWHFWVALDADVSNPNYYPENYYYPIAMESPTGIKIVTSPFIWKTIDSRKENPIYKYPRVIRLDTTGPQARSKAELYSSYPGYVIMGYGAVLHMTLQIINVLWGIDPEHKKDHKTEVVMLGCDHCCYPGKDPARNKPRRRFWDEIEAFNQRRPAYDMKTQGEEAIFDIEKTLDLDVEVILPMAGRKQFGNQIKPGITKKEFNKQLPVMQFNSQLTPMKSPTNGENILVNAMYDRQREYAMKYVDGIRTNGVPFWKFAKESQGFLDLPSITTVEQLQQKLGIN